MTSEARILEKLHALDKLHDRLQPQPTGASPRPPTPAWVLAAQKRNPWFKEIFEWNKTA
jgi:hypothetical protein